MIYIMIYISFLLKVITYLYVKICMKKWKNINQILGNGYFLNYGELSVLMYASGLHCMMGNVLYYTFLYC